MAQSAEIQVTPEEARFLRRFFRRQALPYLLVLGAAAITAARWSAPAAPGFERRLQEAAAAVDALRAENAALRAEIETLGKRMQAAVDRRLDALEGRVAAVERPPNAPVADPSDVVERIGRLEERLASASGGHDTVARSNLARLNDLESRVDALEGAAAVDPVPASPAP
jgi:uncharacterized protein YlxW (UPF0749 family)